jgi:hypothetical protein
MTGYFPKFPRAGLGLAAAATAKEMPKVYEGQAGKSR